MRVCVDLSASVSSSLFALALIALTYCDFTSGFTATRCCRSLATNAVVILIGAWPQQSDRVFMIYTDIAALFVVIGPFTGKMSAMQTVYTLLTLFLFIFIEETRVFPTVEVLLLDRHDHRRDGGIGADGGGSSRRKRAMRFCNGCVIRDQFDALDVEKGKSDALCSTSSGDGGGSFEARWRIDRRRFRTSDGAFSTSPASRR